MNEKEKQELDEHNAKYRANAEIVIPQLKRDVIMLLELENYNPIYRKLKDIQFWSQYLKK